MRYDPNPDPRPKENSGALKPDEADEPGGEVSGQPEQPDGQASQGTEAGPPKAPNYIGAFGLDTNWLEEWTFFGKESDYDTREAGGAEGSR